MSAARARLRGVLLPGVLASLGIVVLLGLGFWQLERREWKQALIARIQMRTAAPVAPLPPEAAWPKVNAEADEYRRVTLSGVFRHDEEAPVYTLLSQPRGRFSGPGYWLMTPLELANGAIVIVNRGFVPQDRRDAATRAAAQVAGPVTITGFLRTPEERRLFTPANDPERNQWFTRNAAEIAAAKGLQRVAPFTVDADAAPNPGGLPQGGETRLSFPDNHLQYALTWFGLAAALAGVFSVFAWQRLRPSG